MPVLRPRPKEIIHLTNSRNPTTLIGMHVIGFLDDYPLKITLAELPNKPLHIHFGGEYGGGKDFEYFLDDELREALEKAARMGAAAEASAEATAVASPSAIEVPKTPGNTAALPAGIKILDAHTAETIVRYNVPVNDVLPQHNGKRWKDVIQVVGLKLEGMKTVGYIWGEDVEKGWEEFCNYCGTFIATEEQLKLIEAGCENLEKY
ncbi:hypothetical protein ABW19_dt0203685 [Dactylella cylindrospora]|nr:hypothetical protein ABW19_dt0203685 [Dactylella cylindrospora]